MKHKKIKEVFECYNYEICNKKLKEKDWELLKFFNRKVDDNQVTAYILGKSS